MSLSYNTANILKMKLTDQAIKLLKQKNVRMAIAVKLGFTDQWVYKSLNKNKDNGPLTTVHALRVIKKETGLTNSEILLEESIVV